MTNDVDQLSNVSPYLSSDRVVVGNSASRPFTHTGSLSHTSSSGSLVLNDVLVVPFITTNLISISKLTSDNQCLVIYLFIFLFWIYYIGPSRTGSLKHDLFVLNHAHCALLTSLHDTSLHAPFDIW